MNFEPNTITVQIDEKSIDKVIKDLTVDCELRQENGITTFTCYKFHVMATFTITPEKQNGLVSKLRFKYCSGDKTCFNNFFVSTKNRLADKPPARFMDDNKLTLDDVTWSGIREKCASKNSEKKALGFAQLGMAAQNEDNDHFLADNITSVFDHVDPTDPFVVWSFVFALKRTWPFIGGEVEYRYVAKLQYIYQPLPPGKGKDELGKMLFGYLNFHKYGLVSTSNP
jgi:hypothetical protein